MNLSSLAPILPPLSLSTAFRPSPGASPDPTAAHDTNNILDPGPSSSISHRQQRPPTMVSPISPLDDAPTPGGSRPRPFKSALVLESQTATVNGRHRNNARPVKRKRESTEDLKDPNSASGGSAGPPDHHGGHGDAPKKKKANRACYACQKAHLTCDDSRPCQRCVKKGCADQCIEGQRKKAKYLLEDDELEELKIKTRASQPALDGNASDTLQAPMGPSFMDSNTLFPTSFDPFPFASDAANLEYNIISQILNSNAPLPLPPSNTSQSQVQKQEEQFGMMWQDPVPQQQQNPMPQQLVYQQAAFNYVQPQPQQQQQQQQQQQPVYSVPRPTTNGIAPPSPPASNSNDSPSTSLGQQQQVQGVRQQQQQQQQFTYPAADEVYGSVTQGYDYTEGYHFLMKFLTERRFEKNDILRVVRALAIFRPSLIALQMPLSEEDETFVEKSLQRSLIELEKLIGFSGTPTVVWRRTGEICLVGEEFCLLTGWQRENLLTGTKYIYELFEDQSVVEYWEKFASHAFENSSQSVFTHCVLLKPDGAPVPCAFCFSIRRDIFDLPSVVIGQWLPLL